MASERVSVHRDLSRIGVVDAGEHFDERGLSGTVGSQEGQDAAGVDVEVDPGQGECPAEPLAEPADADQRRRPQGRDVLQGSVGSVMHGHLRGVGRRVLSDLHRCHQWGEFECFRHLAR